MVSCSSLNLKSKWMKYISECVCNMHLNISHDDNLSAIPVPLEIPISYYIHCMHCNAEIKKNKNRKHCGYCDMLFCEICCAQKLPSKLNSNVSIIVCILCHKKNIALSKNTHQKLFVNDLKKNFKKGRSKHMCKAIYAIDLNVIQRQRMTIINSYEKEKRYSSKKHFTRSSPVLKLTISQFCCFNIFILFFFVIFVEKCHLMIYLLLRKQLKKLM